MTSLVIDSWAWVEYLRGSVPGRRVRQELESGSTIITSSVTVADVVSKCRRERLDVEAAYKAITTSSKVVALDAADARDAGALHGAMKSEKRDFSLADAVVLNLARRTGSKVLTGDPDFSGVRVAEMIGPR